MHGLNAFPAFPAALRDLAPLALLVNPQIRNFSPENGFMTCEVTNERWTTHLHTLEDVTSAQSASTVSATFTVEAGTAGVFIDQLEEEAAGRCGEH